jgi:hypothetical protein
VSADLQARSQFESKMGARRTAIELLLQPKLRPAHSA